MSWNGVSVIPLQTNERPDVVVHSDASGSWGCEAVWDEGWIHYKWPPELTHTPITPKETLPIVLACTVWGQMWKTKTTLMYRDNEAAVTSIN